MLLSIRRKTEGKIDINATMESGNKKSEAQREIPRSYYTEKATTVVFPILVSISQSYQIQKNVLHESSHKSGESKEIGPRIACSISEKCFLQMDKEVQMAFGGGKIQKPGV